MTKSKERSNSDLYYGLYALGSFDEGARNFLETSAERIKGLEKENKRLREALEDIRQNSSCTMSVCRSRKELEQSK